MIYAKHPYFVMHFVILLWGITAIFGKLTQVDAITLVWWRMGIAHQLVCIYMALFFKRKTVYFSPKAKVTSNGYREFDRATLDIFFSCD